MRQKLFTFLLAIVTSSGIYASDVYTKGYLNGIEYTLYTNLTASVTGRDKNTTITTANIPEAVSTNDYTFAVTRIGWYAFSGCSSLTSVTIPNSVTSIGNYAFRDCSSMISVTIGNSVTDIGEYAFDGCESLTSVTIPNSVTSIGNSAFQNCTGLTFVKIPNSVTSIGKNVFSECSSLISIEIPNSVTSIGDFAFYLCSSLTSVTIPNSVTSIGNSAFDGCSSLTSVTIGNSVTSIGDGAFINCSGLTSVNIPNSVDSIGWYAFSGCSSLTSVTIPNSITSIGEGTFGGCSSLISVTIPNSVTRIGVWAFSGCSSLTSVTNYASTPQNLGSNVWDEVDKSIPLYVPAGSISAYKSADQWKDFRNILPIGAQPADVTTTTVTPSATTADIAWPQVTGADTYTIDIKKNGELICTLTFDEEGHLINLSFAAPARYNAPQQTQAAGFAFTVTSLDSGTTYSYTMTAKGNNGNVLKTESGSFTTTGDAQGVEEVLSNQVPSTKILRNGQIFILRGDKIYNAQGALVK